MEIVVVLIESNGSTFYFYSGYMAPEYALHGHLTDKADVYSFGIVALEIVSGRRNTLQWGKEEAFYLLDWVNILGLSRCTFCP